MKCFSLAPAKTCSIVSFRSSSRAAYFGASNADVFITLKFFISVSIGRGVEKRFVFGANYKIAVFIVYRINAKKVEFFGGLRVSLSSCSFFNEIRL